MSHLFSIFSAEKEVQDKISGRSWT